MKLVQKIKVKFFDQNVRHTFLNIVAVLATIATLYSIFGQIPPNLKTLFGVVFVAILVVLYIAIWVHANCTKKVQLKINDTNVNLFIGDIFAQEGLKVIGVNDFFDTIADDKIIAKESLHGIFLNKYKNRINEINSQIDNSNQLKEFIIEKNIQRNSGKSTRYELGTVFEYDSYVLSAFTIFNTKDMAFLSAEEYIHFWMRFWQNIDMIYAGRNIFIPLMGAGITRFRGLKPSKQQLLEIMLWTLKISGFQCTYSDKSINFIIYSKDANEIDFYRIKKLMY